MSYFVIYINDIIHHIKKTQIQLFADDTLIYVAGDNINMVVDTLNNEINNVTQWLNKNNLSLNIDKTKFMVVRKKLNTIDVNSHMGIWVDGVKIEQVQEFKYLGVIIDEHLTFSKHASYVTRKIAQKVNALGRVRKTLSKWSKVLIYKTIIVPHLNYCPTILFLLNNSEIATMQKRQNQALRIILDTNRYANSSVEMGH